LVDEPTRWEKIGHLIRTPGIVYRMGPPR
jgi:hypothetical protein